MRTDGVTFLGAGEELGLIDAGYLEVAAESFGELREGRCVERVAALVDEDGIGRRAAADLPP
jgi:hypothetical protein